MLRKDLRDQSLEPVHLNLRIKTSDLSSKSKVDNKLLKCLYEVRSLYKDEHQMIEGSSPNEPVLVSLLEYVICHFFMELTDLLTGCRIKYFDVDLQDLWWKHKLKELLYGL